MVQIFPWRRCDNAPFGREFGCAGHPLRFVNAAGILEKSGDMKKGEGGIDYA